MIKILAKILTIILLIITTVILLVRNNELDKKFNLEFNNKTAVNSNLSFSTTKVVNKSVKLLEANLLPTTANAVHSVNVISIGKGNLLAVWFSGSSESASDIEICQAIYKQGHWLKPTVALNRNQLRYYFSRTFGNPILYKIGNKIHLIVVESIGGWAVARLGHFVSKDYAMSWQEQQLLFTSPLFNISTLVRNPPLVEQNRIIIPAYHESINYYPQLLVFDQDGRIQNQMAITEAKGLIQPDIEVYNNQLFMLLRTIKLRLDHSLYGIKTVGDNLIKFKTNLQNFNSALACLQVKPNLFLLVYNQGQGRNKLMLASSYNMKDWHDIYQLEQGEESKEFSYPSIILVDDKIHILYTYHRTNIKHVVLKVY